MTNHRHFIDHKLVLATNNKDKIQELTDLLIFKQKSLQLISLIDFAIPSPEETGLSFKDNADLKSDFYMQQTGLPCLAEDSGLAIDALGGDPGIYSARWAGPDKNYDLAFKRIKDGLSAIGLATSPARFVCSLSLRWPDGHCENFESDIKGLVSFPKRGDKGMAYDAIFTPDGYDQTFGEMGPSKKNLFSHRAKAVKHLISACFNE